MSADFLYGIEVVSHRLKAGPAFALTASGLVCGALAAAPAMADVAEIGEVCVGFMQGDPAAFDGWQSAPCNDSLCSNLVETTIWTAPSDLDGLVIETGAPDDGPLAGQRRCDVIAYPEAGAVGFEAEAAAWIDAKLSDGSFWAEGRSVYGCGLGDQGFTVSNLLIDGVWIFAMSLRPDVDPACEGGF